METYSVSHVIDKTAGASHWKTFSRLQKAAANHKAANMVQSLLIHTWHALAPDPAPAPTGREEGLVVSLQTKPIGVGGLGGSPLSWDLLESFFVVKKN